MLLNFILAVIFKRRKYSGTSMAVQWLRLCALSAGTTGSIPGQAKKIPQCSEKKKKKKEKIFNANLQEQQAGRDCSAKNLYSNLKADPEVLGFPHQTWHFNFPTKSSVTLKDQILFSPYIICIKPIRRARETCILGLVILFSIKSKQSQYIKIFCFLSLWFLESCWGLFLSQNKIPISQENLSFPFPPHQPQVFWGGRHDAPTTFRTYSHHAALQVPISPSASLTASQAPGGYFLFFSHSPSYLQFSQSIVWHLAEF